MIRGKGSWRGEGGGGVLRLWLLLYAYFEVVRYGELELGI